MAYLAWCVRASVLLLTVVLAGCRSRGDVRPESSVPHVDGASIVVPKVFQQRAGIVVQAVAKRTISPRVEAVGSVTFDPAHVAAIGTRLRGTVRRVLKVEGDKVKPGDALAEIESAELGEAQADVSVARAHVEAAEVQEKREAWLVDKQLSTARELELARAQRKEHQARLTAASQRAKALGGVGGPMGVQVLRSPIAGEVVQRDLAPGQSVDPNHTAFRVANLDHLWIEIAVFERDMKSVREGDAVSISALTEPDNVIQGHVAHVGQVVHPVTQTIDVRVYIHNEARALRAGQSVRASVNASGPARTSVVLPREAVSYVDGKPTVFLRDSDVRFRAVSVRLGVSDGKSHEVLDGVAESDQVVTAGVFALKSELFR